MKTVYDFLFKTRSPLMGWFVLMEIIAGGYIVGHWIEYFRYGPKPWEHGEINLLITGLFIISNVMMFRHRRWAIIGFVVCWLLMALALTTI